MARTRSRNSSRNILIKPAGVVSNKNIVNL
jgi:hypothetical protein